MITMDSSELTTDPPGQEAQASTQELDSMNESQARMLELPAQRNSMIHSSLYASIPRAVHSPPTTKTRLQHFRDARRTMTEGLLNANEDLLDLASDLQAQVAALELENRYLRQGLHMPSIGASRHDFNPSGPLATKQYAVILLDADAYCFRHEYLVDGTNGGRRAADELYLRASEYLNQELHVAPGEPVPLLVKAYAYHTGLSNALQRVGLIKNGKDFELFVESFNQRVPLFDFANVGSGKERADNKIREWLEHYLEQQQCRHIILGCGHDTGYETYLQKFAADERTRNKITMLDGPKTNINFRALGFHKRLALWTVFAPENLPRSPRLRNASPTIATTATSGQSSQQRPAVATAATSVQQSPNQTKGKLHQQHPSAAAKGPRRQSSQQQRAGSRAPQYQQQQTPISRAASVSGAHEVQTATGQEEKGSIPARESNEVHRPVSHTPEPSRQGIWQGWWQRLSGSHLLGVG